MAEASDCAGPADPDKSPHVAPCLRVGLAVFVAVAVVGCSEIRSGEQEGAIPPPAAAPPIEASRSSNGSPRSSTSRSTPKRSRGRSERPTPSGLLSTADERSFARLERQLGGELGLVVGPLGQARRRQTLGSLRSGAAWSTIKLPISVRVLEDAGGPENLASGDSQRIRRALTASDNAAAAGLWRDLTASHGGAAGAAGAVEEILRKAGDRSTRVSTQGRDGFSPYGQTRWSLAAQQRFMASLAGGCATSAAVSGRVLSLMDEVIASQQWGLGSAGRPARFKGGWGPGPEGRYLVRQVGVIENSAGNRAVAIALAAKSSDGSFEGGSRALTRVAKWAAEHIDPNRARRGDC